MSSPPVYLSTVATALPPYGADQDLAASFFREHYGNRLSPRSLKVMENILGHPGIRRRHFALEDPACLVDEDPDSRIERFTRWAVTLSVESAAMALAEAGLSPQDVSALIVNTCTGYLCPGISSYLIERLGLLRDVRAFDLVGSGCGGAIPNISMGASLLPVDGDGRALCVSVEICSATFQMADDLSLILSNSIFADGAAAAVIGKKRSGLEIIRSSTRHLPEERDTIRYIHRGGQLHNQLSRRLPKVIGRTVAQAVHSLLEPMGLSVPDVDHWAVHGGGESVLASVGREVDLPEAKLAPSRRVLERCGNMSSPSVLFVLKDIMAGGIEPGSWLVLVAFGAGLSAHAMLLRAV